MYDKALISTVAVAVLLALLGIPLVLRKVPRNHVYGFRTPSTLADDDLWYEANAHGGRGLIVAGIVSVVLELALYENGRGLEPHTYLRSTVAALIAPLALAAVRTLFYIRTLRG